MIMLQAAIRKFRLKKCTKSEANLTQIIEPKEIDVHDKDCVLIIKDNLMVQYCVCYISFTEITGAQ